MKPKDDKKLAAIASATFQLASERGLQGLTLAEIARGAGIATSTLYVYYPSKEALLDALYQNAKTATFARWLDDDDGGAPFKARVRNIWNNMLSHRLEHHAQLAFQEQYHSAQLLSAASRELGARFAQFFHALLVEGQAQELLKTVGVPFLIASILGSTRETANQVRAGSVPNDAATRATAFLLCWDAIKA
jgi:TetR/AcrR family transcriptional repressor of multidrug resistance operon